MELADIVLKLTGEIEPTGDSNVDNERLNNQEELIKAVTILLNKIIDNSKFSNENNYSMKVIGEKAKIFIDDIVDEYKNI